MKKAKTKSKEAASNLQKPTPKTRLRKADNPVDLREVRKRITAVVGPAAPDIMQAIVDEAKKGQLAHAKYALESGGVYPGSEEDSARPEEDSLAQRLLRRLGLPEQPVINETEEECEGAAQHQPWTKPPAEMESQAGKEKRTLPAPMEEAQSDTVE